MWNKIINFIKKQWLLVWVVVSAVIILSMVSMAAYISTNSSMKRVVASISSQGKLFSSNVLVEDGVNTYIPRYFPALSDTTQTYPVEIILWNYDLTNPAKWYPEDIDYTVTFTLTDSEGTPLTSSDIGSRSVIVSDIDDTQLAVLSESALTYTRSADSLTYNSATASENKYRLLFSGNWNLDNDTEICVKVDVQFNKNGDEKKYQDLSALGGIIGLKRSVSTESAGWQAYVSEKGNSPVSNFDGYNLIVTGSGEATITIKWDTRFITCNKYFCDGSIYNFGTYSDNSKEVDYTQPASGSNIATLVIKANSSSAVTNYRNRYDIQFYKTGKGQPADWNFITNNESALSNTVWLYTGVSQAGD